MMEDLWCCWTNNPRLKHPNKNWGCARLKMGALIVYTSQASSALHPNEHIYHRINPFIFNSQQLAQNPVIWFPWLSPLLGPVNPPGAELFVVNKGMPSIASSVSRSLFSPSRRVREELSLEGVLWVSGEETASYAQHHCLWALQQPC